MKLTDVFSSRKPTAPLPPPLKRRVYTSFDCDHDQVLQDAIVAQAKRPDSPFIIADRSIKMPMARDWTEKTLERIKRVDLVIILCSEYTHFSPGVAIEIRCARQLGKPYLLLKGYPNSPCAAPESAGLDDKIHDWGWKELKSLVLNA
jgi:hypothetical protein